MHTRTLHLYTTKTLIVLIREYTSILDTCTHVQYTVLYVHCTVYSTVYAEWGSECQRGTVPSHKISDQFLSSSQTSLHAPGLPSERASTFLTAVCKVAEIFAIHKYEDKYDFMFNDYAEPKLWVNIHTFPYVHALYMHGLVQCTYSYKMFKNTFM